MTRLSVNINKVALIRNARGGKVPNLVQVAMDCERFGADGVTVHPRPDERHIRYQDCRDIRPLIKTEFNIEGYPSDDWLKLVKELKPDQATLVPDKPDALTSDTGWDTIAHKEFLTDVVEGLKSEGIRVSLFTDPVKEIIQGAKETGTDRIELYTGPFAHQFKTAPQDAVLAYSVAADYANAYGLGVNAGHDLNLDNLRFFVENVPGVLEVSIGHALISDSLYYGLENTVQMYKRLIRN